MSFVFEPQEIPAVVLVRRPIHRDPRGHFAESYKRSAFHDAGLTEDFVQDNIAFSEGGVLRGLHYQLAPHAQGKLVSVVRGEILDVAVDLRKSEPTFGTWVAASLTAERGEMLWVPAGFAHGYYVVSQSADVAYKVTAEYAPQCDRGLSWNDPDIGIDWPSDDPILSEKDRALPRLTEIGNPF